MTTEITFDHFSNKMLFAFSGLLSDPDFRGTVRENLEQTPTRFLTTARIARLSYASLFFQIAANALSSHKFLKPLGLIAARKDTACRLKVAEHLLGIHMREIAPQKLARNVPSDARNVRFAAYAQILALPNMAKVLRASISLAASLQPEHAYG